MKYAVKLNDKTIAHTEDFDSAFAVASDLATLATADKDETMCNLDTEVGASVLVGIGERNQAVKIEVTDNADYIETADALLQTSGLQNALDSKLADINARIKAFNAKRQAQKAEAKKEASEPKETINEAGYAVDDIVYIVWGYEQTNIDFYKVTKVTKKSISVIRIAKHYESVNHMVDNVTPDPEQLASYDTFNSGHKEGKAMRVMTSVARPSINNHSISKYSGQKLTETSYY